MWKELQQKLANKVAVIYWLISEDIFIIFWEAIDKLYRKLVKELLC